MLLLISVNDKAVLYSFKMSPPTLLKVGYTKCEGVGGGRQLAGRSRCRTWSGKLDLMEAGCNIVGPAQIKLENDLVLKSLYGKAVLRKKCA